MGADSLREPRIPGVVLLCLKESLTEGLHARDPSEILVVESLEWPGPFFQIHKSHSIGYGMARRPSKLGVIVLNRSDQ